MIDTIIISGGNIQNGFALDFLKKRIKEGGRESLALVAADSGMADIVHIIEQSRNALVSGGFLLLEHGWQQGEAVRQAFILAGYHDVETCRDYGDNERVTLGRYYQ